MAKVESIQSVVGKKLCISCGACVSEAPEGAMRMVLDESAGMYLPEIVDPEKVNGRGSEFAVCPGVGLPIEQISRHLYGSELPNSPELGRYRLGLAAHSTDPEVLAGATSGGMMTAIAIYLMEEGLVDGVTVVNLEYGKSSGPRPVAKIASSLEDLLAAQGAKYCPTSVNVLVKECVKRGGRYLFLGAPCQVGALRLAIREHPELAEVFPFTMAHFCGGFRDFRQTDWLISKHAVDPSEVRYFRYRGGGQPGSMVARTEDGRSVTEPYPNYMKGCRIQKLKRCVFCIDGTGLLADFACGDAWLDRYIQHESPWSIILVRSKQAEQIVLGMIERGRMVAEPVSADNIIGSQLGNLTSKVRRQYIRMRLAGLMGVSLPSWDVDLPRHGTTVLRELRILALKCISRWEWLFNVLMWLKKQVKGG